MTAPRPPAPVPLFLVNADEPYAYACGHCGFVRVGYDTSRKWTAEDTEATHAEALRCCACMTCGAFVPRDSGFFGHTCDTCRAAQRAADEALRAALAVQAREDAASFEDAERSHHGAYTFTVNGRTGRAYLCDDYGGGFAQGFARLDPTPDDPTPRVYHNGLQRSEAYAVLEPVLTLCGDLDAVLTEWREVSP